LCARDLEGKFMVMLTKKGLIKRTDAKAFAKIRATGIRAIGLREGDELVFCTLSGGQSTIIIATSNGQGIRFKEDEVRVMGRQAAGVIGVRLKGDDFVVGMEVVEGDEGNVLFATRNGYGKRVRIADFRVAHRGGVGVKTIPADKRNGKVIGLALVSETSNILLIDEGGKIIRLSPKEIRTMGRQAKGVRLIRLDKGQKLATLVAFDEEDPSSQKASPDKQGEGGNSSSDGSSSGSAKKVESKIKAATAGEAEKLEVATEEIVETVAQGIEDQEEEQPAVEEPQQKADEPEELAKKEVEKEEDVLVVEEEVDEQPVVEPKKKQPEAQQKAGGDDFVQNSMFDFSSASEKDDSDNDPDSFVQF